MAQMESNSSQKKDVSLLHILVNNDQVRSETAQTFYIAYGHQYVSENVIKYFG